MESHEHIHQHHALHKDTRKNIATAFFLNFFFAIIELFGGLYTNSVAILSDAIHDFGDSLAIGVSFFLQKKSSKGRDKFYSYGYKRFSLLGAIFISAVLVVSSIFVIRESILRFMEPKTADAPGMILLAVLGIIVNGAAVLRMKGSASMNERSVFLHMMEDVLGWIAVLVGAIVMYFTSWSFIDPLMSVGISLWVLYNVFNNLSSTLKIMLQEVPADVDIEKMLMTIKQDLRIKEIHDVHLWSLDGQDHIMTIHLVLADDLCTATNLADIKLKCRQVCTTFGVEHVTIETEGCLEAQTCDFCR